jgi:hypothetical protein
VIWDTNTGEVIDLGVMNGPNSWANAITNAGEAAGTTGTQFTSAVEAWRYADGQVHMLGPVPGGLSSVGNAMNENRVVAGGTHLPAGPPGSPSNQGALWSQGKWQLIPLLVGANGGSPLAINDLNQAVGRNVFSPGVTERATLWQHEIVYELAELLANPPASFAFHRGTAANATGQILVRGNLSGKTVGFLLEPIDRPITDLNADCVTDVHDVLMLLYDWGKPNSPADFTGTGVVDVFDLLFLLSNWG